MMYFEVNGGKRLNGEIKINSAKNSVLPIIACCIMTQNQIVLKNCPPLSDVLAMLDIIKSIGGKAHFSDNDLYIDCTSASSRPIENFLTRPIRSSIFILGPLLSRFKSAKISYPGGCEIGSRPIDIHLSALRALGAKINTENGIIDCDGASMRGKEVVLRLPSVGATENLMMAAASISGTTVIHNAAREPEIVDLADFINKIGGKVFGAGSNSITIEGAKKLSGCEYEPIPDRIIAGTYLAAAAITGGKIRLKNIRHDHIYSIVEKFKEAGCLFKKDGDSLVMMSSGTLKAIKYIQTMPYPGFPTDMQPQLSAVLSLAQGTSIVTESLFDARFKYAEQLKKMGADIETVSDRATINGVPFLMGASVEAHDLRGGAALVVAALGARGASSIHSVEHIDRGYYRIEEDLRMLGAEIVRKHQEKKKT